MCKSVSSILTIDYILVTLFACVLFIEKEMSLCDSFFFLTEEPYHAHARKISIPVVRVI